MHRTNSVPNCNPSPEPGNGCLAAALSYHARGWCPLPLCPPNCCGNISTRHKHPTSRSGKVPLIGGWTKWKSLPTVDEIMAWWKRWPTANVGVAMGRISGLVAVDVDGPEGEAELIRLAGELPSNGLRFDTPSGGYRLLFGWNKEMPCHTRHFGGEGRPLSLLGDGSQSVFPPSVGNDGGPYDWTDELAPDRRLLQETPASVIAMCAGKASQKRPTVGGLKLAMPTPDRGGEMVTRARAYLAECEPAVEGAGGDSRTWKMACKLVGMFGLDSDNALSLLLEWDKGNQPPWGEEALRRKVELARERHQEKPVPPRASLVRTSQGVPTRNVGVEAPTGRQVDDQAEELPGALIDTVPRRPLEWFDQPYVARSQVTAIVGRPGTGKSTYLSHLVARSRHALYFPGEEDIGRMLRPRLEASGAHLDQVRVIPPDDRWVMPYARDSLLKVIRQTGADLVVYDPVDDYLADGVDENANIAVRAVLQAFREVAEQTGAAVVICRHVGKDPSNVMPGSRAWYAHPRSIVELLADRDTPPRRIIRLHKDSLGQNTPARYFELPRVGEHPPRFALGGQVAPELVELVASVTDPMDRKAVDRACELITRLLTGGRMEVKAARQHAESEGLNERTIQRAAEQLRIVRTREGNGKEHRCYWELPK